MKKIVFITLLISQIVTAQVGIGTETPDASSILDIVSADKGILAPRVSLDNINNTMIDGINTNATGLLIWNTNVATAGGNGIGFYAFNGTAWEKIGTGATGDFDWETNGGTAPASINDNIRTFGKVGINTSASSSYQLNVDSGTNTLSSGYFANLSASSLSVKYGLYSVVTGASGSTKYGLYNSLGSIDNTGTLYGTYNYVYDGTNNVELFGSYNNLTGSGNAAKTGTYNNIPINGSGVKTGVHNELVNEATGFIYGVNNVMTNNQLSAQSFAMRNTMTGTSGNKSGIYTQIQNFGNGNNYGVTSVFGGSGTGEQIGTNNLITNTGGNVHIGTEQRFSGDASSMYGVSNIFNGDATTQMIGTNNWFNSLTATHTGIRNFFGQGSNLQTGLINDFQSQNGSQIGTSTSYGSISTGLQIGHRVEFLAASSGVATKYGIFIDANAATAGNLTGLYASIPQANGFAAQLDGNVVINESARARDVRIESDNKPYVFYSDGTNDVVRFGNQNSALAGNGATVNGVVLNYAADFDTGVNGTTIGLGGSEYIADAGNFQIAFNGAVIPALDNLDDLGSATQRWDDVYATSGVVNTSDIRLKKNIKKLEYGLNEILRIEPISYQWKSSSNPAQVKLGFSAQQLLGIIPEVVKTNDIVFDEDSRNSTSIKNENLGVYYSDLIPVLTNAIQEQQELIMALKSTVDELKRQVELIQNTPKD